MKKTEKLNTTQNLVGNSPPLNVINDLISETHGLLSKPYNLANNLSNRTINNNVNSPNPSFTYTACCTTGGGTVVCVTCYSYQQSNGSWMHCCSHSIEDGKTYCNSM